jgi:hypothetical protein
VQRVIDRYFPAPRERDRLLEALDGAAATWPYPHPAAVVQADPVIRRQLQATTHADGWTMETIEALGALRGDVRSAQHAP